MRSLKDGGKRYVEAKGGASLRFIEDDDEYGALLVDGGVSYGKEWVNDSDYSFQTCYKKKTFNKFSSFDKDLFTLTNIEKVKVEDIGEVL